MVGVPLPGFGGQEVTQRVCGACAKPLPVTRITTIAGETRDAPGVITHVYICQECLAEALDTLTGYHVKALLRRWDAMAGRKWRHGNLGDRTA